MSSQDLSEHGSELTVQPSSPKTQSLASRALELELLCQEIDAADGEVTDDMLVRFNDAKLAVSDKVDGWIFYLDAIKYMTEALKERKTRAALAQKTAEKLQERLRSYLKFVIQSNPGLPFAGSEGTIYLHKSPEGVKYHLAFEDKTVYRTVNSALLDMEHTIRPYVTEIRHYVIDSAKLKADLKAGIKLSWCELSNDSHIRIKG